MGHNKLYRNFIILQEDENSHSGSQEKPLSGYAKIEAKSEKCKISFYAQNLKKDEKYSIIIVCYKKEIKQIVDLGFLEVDEVGKGEAVREYYINDIAGLNFSYEKISGAAICKHKNDELSFLMYGFMNNENIKEDWKKSKVVKCADKNKATSYEKKLVKEKKEEHKKEEHKKDECKKEEVKKEECKKEEAKKEIKKEKCDKEKTASEDKHKSENKAEKDECCKEEEKHDKHHEKEEKESHKHNMDYECDVNCNRRDDIDEDKFITQKNFDEYEAEVVKRKENADVDPYDFNLRGAVGDFFNNIVKGFEEVKGKFKEIKYCKWYKIKVNSIDDMCNASDYNKYTVAYYPMLNYYPYIKKYGYFFIGYKCNSKGDLKYIVYAIPGRKDKDEQPYVGKTGFVTWISLDNDKLGCWLMFYDYKNSNIVVPMK